MHNPLYDWDSNSQSWGIVSWVSRPADSAFSKVSPDIATQQKKEFKIEFPLSMHDVIDHLKWFLHPFEITEISNYHRVYFFPVLEWKCPGGMELPKGTWNANFDNDAGEYLFNIWDHIAYWYEIISKLGKGSFGVCVKCFDHKEKKYIAMKIVKNKKKLQKQGIIEVKILETLRDSDPEDKNFIVRVKESFNFWSHLCITFEMLSINLFEHIKSFKYEGFEESLVRKYVI